MFVFLMIRRPPRSTRTDTLIPYTTLFRSEVTLPPGADAGQARSAINALQQGLVIDSPADDTLRVSFTEAALRQRTNAVMAQRSEEHTSELQSLMRISYAVFCLKKKKNK